MTRSAARGRRSTLVGADGCTGGWIAAIDDAGTVTCRRLAGVSDLMALRPAPSVVAIDVPIGLLERGVRDCDVEARRLLGPRRSSVFTAPIRPTLTAASHRDACATQLGIEGKKPSIQTWNIVPKIREVDTALRAHPTWRTVVREVHPELAFFRLNDNRPLLYSKKSREGLAERVRLLERLFPAAVAHAFADRALHCKRDDVLDAFAALWTARRIAARRAARVPAEASVDAFGLPMEIWS